MEKEIKQEIDLLNAFHKEPGITYLENSAKYSKAYFGRLSVNKFQNDKIFKKIGQNLICTDGITLNLKNLLYRHNTKEFGDLILKLYIQYGWKFVERLRGNFSGFVYSEKDNKLMVFTNHLASKPVYYFYDNDSNVLVFSSELKVVVKGMKQVGFVPRLDVGGAYCLLTFGFMLGDLTLVKEIKKLPPGNVLIYENGKIALKEYYKLSSTPYIEDEEEIIKELDRRFKEAVRLEYEKDLEYGYSHIVSLSGGLDSRMNVGYAKKLGFDNITCYTFSESDYLDEKIAKKICSDNNFKFIFFALDNGDFLVDNIDKMVSANNGLVLYGGFAHGYNSLRKLSFSDFGLVHGGLLGGEILGDYLSLPLHYKSADDLITYSKRLINRVRAEHYFKNEFAKYPNNELFKFYSYGVNGTIYTYRMIEPFTEFSSPFQYIDFLDYVMKIHPKHRYGHEIYLKWISSSLPEFSNYKWERYNLSPSDLVKYPSFIKKIYIISIALMRKILNPRNLRHTSMNPFEYWWKTNKTLQKKINSIFNENIRILEDYPELLEDSKYLFKEGSLLEKTQVITLLKGIELLDIKEKRTF